TVVADPEATVARLGERAREAGASVDELDGVTGDFVDWWFNARPSNTEPLLRLNVEAGSTEECAQRLSDVRAWVEEAA
ncbi:MAG TPA: phosphomannomutase/phosphoglucomutase, partial [Acidimicrobiales bacterium]|nr:phosphomannomutase/phosphoglucomutase [Acidimicrobiales bacterium]